MRRPRRTGSPYTSRRGRSLTSERAKTSPQAVSSSTFPASGRSAALASSASSRLSESSTMRRGASRTSRPAPARPPQPQPPTDQEPLTHQAVAPQDQDVLAGNVQLGLLLPDEVELPGALEERHGGGVQEAGLEEEDEGQGPQDRVAGRVVGHQAEVQPQQQLHVRNEA